MPIPVLARPEEQLANKLAIREEKQKGGKQKRKKVSELQATSALCFMLNGTIS